MIVSKFVTPIRKRITIQRIGDPDYQKRKQADCKEHIWVSNAEDGTFCIHCQISARGEKGSVAEMKRKMASQMEKQMTILEREVGEFSRYLFIRIGIPGLIVWTFLKFAWIPLE